MKNINAIKRFCAILILICFVLPLSKCESPAKAACDPQTQTNCHASAQVSSENIEYAYKVAGDQFQELRSGDSAKAAVTLLIYLLVFFAPLALLFLKPIPQLILTLICGFPAAYLLFVQFFVFQALYGSWLLLLGWLLLMGANFYSLWQIMLQARAASIKS